MMKTLHLIRHAKSSWDYPHLSDHQRPLNKRGRKDTAIMAKALNESGVELVNIYSSSATRAQQTIQGIHERWRGQGFAWQVTDELYEFSASNLWHWLTVKFVIANELTLVSHNPGLTDLINQLGDSSLDNFPTCAYAQLRIKDIDSCDGELRLFLKPKMFK